MAISRLIATALTGVVVLGSYAIVPSFGDQRVASVRLKCSEKTFCVSDSLQRSGAELDVYTVEEVDEQVKKQVDALSRKIADLEIQLAKERIKRDLELQQLTATLAKRLNELPLEVVRHNAAYEMLRNRLLKDFEQVFTARPNP
jgi:hypothetical protein